MKTSNYSSWLVPVKIAKKLKEIGFDSLEIFVDESGSWYRGDEIFYIDTDGELTTVSVKDTYLSRDKRFTFVPTYTYEQVFEWFREKGFYSYIDKKSFPERYVYYIKYGMVVYSKENLMYDLLPKTYEEARQQLVNKLIQLCIELNS